jgi:hypothetical protein
MSECAHHPSKPDSGPLRPLSTDRVSAGDISVPSAIFPASKPSAVAAAIVSTSTCLLSFCMKFLVRANVDAQRVGTEEKRVVRARSDRFAAE